MDLVVQSWIMKMRSAMSHNAIFTGIFVEQSDGFHLQSKLDSSDLHNG